MEDVRYMGLNQASEWIVKEIARLCQAIHDEYLDPSLDSFRARLDMQQRVAAP